MQLRCHWTAHAAQVSLDGSCSSGVTHLHWTAHAAQVSLDGSCSSGVTRRLMQLRCHSSTTGRLMQTFMQLWWPEDPRTPSPSAGSQPEPAVRYYSIAWILGYTPCNYYHDPVVHIHCTGHQFYYLSPQVVRLYPWCSARISGPPSSTAGTLSTRHSPTYEPGFIITSTASV